MEKQVRPNHIKLWLTLSFLLGAALLLVACAAPEVTATPVPQVACPTVQASEPVDFDAIWAASPHAKTDAEAFRHWDDTNPREIPITCAQCHSRPGFLDYLGVDGTQAGSVDNPAPVGSTITCYVCHNEAVANLDNVTFISGKRIGGLGREALCISCHQGRGSTPTLNSLISAANLPTDNTPSADLPFLNSHSTSAATEFGTEVQGAYEYDGRTYHARFMRGDEFFACTRCHDQHSLTLKIETCSECHTFDGNDPKNIRVNTTDFDGDGNITEGIAFEIEQIHVNLYTAIQTYARDVVGVPIVYSLDTHPYFFTDTNANGVPDPDETVSTNAYASWTPRLLRAAYNYNYVSHDPGAFAHNSTYILQILYDSLADIGGNTAGMTRP